MLASLQITCNCYIGVTRIMVGMSLDRTLPAWLSKISPRFRSPLNAHLIYFLLGVAWLIGYTYVTSWTKLTLGVTFAAGYVFVVSSLAAALLPYRAKALYEAAPGSQYKLAGIPLVTIFGTDRLRPRRHRLDRVPVEPGLRPAWSGALLGLHRGGRHLRRLPGRLLDRPRSTRRARASTSPTPSSKSRRSDARDAVNRGGADRSPRRRPVRAPHGKA